MTYPLWNLIHNQHDQHNQTTKQDPLDLFLTYIQSTSLTLYQAQEDAFMEIASNNNVILNTPTGSGKSLVALFMHFYSLMNKRRSFYTAPIKALVNEKFLSLCQLFGPDQVGLMTGDASVNNQAPIICCTAEILANLSLRCFEQTNVNDVIIDEFHYFSDRDRGTAWQIPLLTLPHCRFLLMSATMGDSSIFEKALTKLTNAPTVTITSSERPVPLEFQYEETPLESILEKLVSGKKVPVYIVHFTQNECATTAQSLLSLNFTTKEEKQKIASLLVGVDFRTPYGKDLNRLLRHGIGIHHAGLLPKYRVLVEKLAKAGLLKIICGTDTLGVGVNIPIRTVLLTKMNKFDGEKSTLLSCRDFHQIAGRAGRKGYDEEGTVIVMAPAHVIENKKNEIKNKNKDNNKNKKIVKAKPPEKGYVPWDKQVFERILNSPPEPLKSSFKISHGLLLNVLSGQSAQDNQSNQSNQSNLRKMKRIIDTSFESETIKKRLKNEAMILLRSLYHQKIIEFNPLRSPISNSLNKNLFRVNVDLQEDFSLMHSLSLYLLDTIDKKLDPYLEDYPIRLLSLAESIIENPKIILTRQVDKIKRELMLQMKQEGIEYEERIEKLEEVDYPRPLRDFIYDTFNEFSYLHPWVGKENIRPKSIAREMIENFYSFNDYIHEYNLERSEGVLLRYLMEVYKILNQTIPEKLKDERIMDMISYIESLIREVDSGILDEWKQMKDPESYMKEMLHIQEKEKEKELLKLEKMKELGILANIKVFEDLVRNAIFHIVKGLGLGQLERVLELINNDNNNDENDSNENVTNKTIINWNKEKLEKLLDAYYDTCNEILITLEARSKKHTIINKENNNFWLVEQKLIDSEGESDFYLKFQVDLKKSQKLGRPYIKLLGF